MYWLWHFFVGLNKAIHNEFFAASRKLPCRIAAMFYCQLIKPFEHNHPGARCTQWPLFVIYASKRLAYLEDMFIGRAIFQHERQVEKALCMDESSLLIDHQRENNMLTKVRWLIWKQQTQKHHSDIRLLFATVYAGWDHFASWFPFWHACCFSKHCLHTQSRSTHLARIPPPGISSCWNIYHSSSTLLRSLASKLWLRRTPFFVYSSRKECI